MAIPDSELEAIVRRVVGELHGTSAAAPATARRRVRPAATRWPRPAATACSRRFPRPSTRPAGRSVSWRRAASRRASRRSRRSARSASTRPSRWPAPRTRRPGLGRVRDKVAKMQLAATRSVGTEDFDEPRAFAGQHGLTIEDWLPWGVVGIRDAHQLAVGVHDQPRHHDDRGRQRRRLQRASGLPLDVDAHRRADEPGRGRRRRSRQPDDRRRGAVARLGPRARHPRRRRHALHHRRRRAGARRVRHRQARHRRRPGHARVGVDDTADVRWAAAEILKGAIFDNTILCIGEKAVVAADGVYQPLLDAFAELPAHVLVGRRDRARLPGRDRRRRQGPLPHARASSWARRRGAAGGRRHLLPQAGRTAGGAGRARPPAVLDGAVLPVPADRPRKATPTPPSTSASRPRATTGTRR